MPRAKGNRLVTRTRMVFGLISLVLIAQGIASTNNVLPFGQNYWGGLVFGPISIVTGVLLLFVAAFRWRQSTRTHTNKDSKT